MKKLLTLLFTVLISINSYGEWVKVSVGAISGNTSYIEVDKIREQNSYVYFWTLQDFLKPNDWGDMSIKAYWQGDCGLGRTKTLSRIFYPQPMGEGVSESNNSPLEWEYHAPDSVGDGILDYACNLVN
jgi:hypothetical protein